MALFSSLSEKFNHIFSKLTKRGRLTELEIKTAMREVRAIVDKIEVEIDDEIWELPKYSEMLFIY